MPITDLLVDAAVGYEVISFMDDNRRYFEISSKNKPGNDNEPAYM